MRHVILLATLMAVGCTPQLPEPVQTPSGVEYLTLNKDATYTSRSVLLHEETYTDVQSSQSCSYAGFCFGCGLDFNAKMTCGYGFRYFCQGTQMTLEDQKIQTYYNEYHVKEPKGDGAVYKTPSKTAVHRSNVRTMTACS